MLEGRYQLPSVAEIEMERSYSENVSILLFKPEVNFLELEEKIKLTQLLKSHFAIHGDPICVFPLLLDREAAKRLWQRNVEQFLWAESYYQHMTSASCIAIILAGRDSACILKKIIRVEMFLSIARIKKALGSGFTPDIVHGSDYSDGLSELQTFMQIVGRNSQSS